MMGAKLTLKTQIGGKFSRHDPGIFRLKSKLLSCGIEVSHPKGDRIVAEHHGMALSFEPSPVRALYLMEQDYFKNIQDNSVHIVNNKICRRAGYIGESAAIEIAFAMTKLTPIILLYRPVFSSTVPPRIKRIIQNSLPMLFVKRLDLMNRANLLRYIGRIAREQIDYGLPSIDTIEIHRYVCRMFEGYWKMG